MNEMTNWCQLQPIIFNLLYIYVYPIHLEHAQVFKALDQARNTQLRALCVRVRKALAETVRSPDVWKWLANSENPDFSISKTNFHKHGFGLAIYWKSIEKIGWLCICKAAIEQLPPGTTLEGSKVQTWAELALLALLALFAQRVCSVRNDVHGLWGPERNFQTSNLSNLRACFLKTLGGMVSWSMLGPLWSGAVNFEAQLNQSFFESWLMDWWIDGLMDWFVAFCRIVSL